MRIGDLTFDYDICHLGKLSDKELIKTFLKFLSTNIRIIIQDIKKAK